jgi:methyl-accepting chemotaxis protein
MSKLFGKVSVRTMLGGLIGIMGLVMSLMCANYLLVAWQRCDAGQQVATLSVANKAIFQVMQTYRIERGDTMAALETAGDPNPNSREAIARLRATVDSQLAIAMPILDRSANPGLAAVRDKAKADLQTVNESRAFADTALQQPSAARDRALVQSFMSRTQSFLEDMERCATVLEAEMQRLDPTIGDLALVRSAGWSARSAVGSKALPLIGAMSRNRGLTPAEHLSFQIAQGRASAFWEVVRNVVTREDAAPELKAAYDHGLSGYFNSDFAKQMDEVARALAAGETPPVPLSAWQLELTKHVGTVGEVAGVAADLTTRRANEDAAAARNMVMVYGGLLVFALAFAIGGFVLVRVRVSRPITAIADVMRRLAANDLSVSVPGTDRGDEIGQMANAVLVFKDNMVETERLRAEQASAEQRIATQRKTEMHKLADAFQAAIGGIVETVSSASTHLEAAANTLTKTAETTQQLSTSVASASEEASVNVNSVASASEELSGSVDEIARQVKESSKIATQAVQQAQNTDSRIAQLSQAAARIGDVVKLITSVAEQTNLLALNATIEAARAGDAGRGFAVVAHEVKALAAQTAKATDEIGAQITGMQTATQESVAAIKEIGGTIGRMSEIAAAIAATVEQQGVATQEISRNVQQAAQGTAEVATSISSVSRGASETGTASTQVLASAQSLSQQSGHLKVEVEKFLTTIRAA